DARVEERPEERAEEHHFREDEPAHRPAEGHVHLAVEEAAFAFADHRAEPAEQHVDQREEADPERDPAPAVAIHQEDAAAREEEHEARGTSKNVYESEMVARSAGASPFTRKTTGISRVSPGRRVCSVKQKHSRFSIQRAALAGAVFMMARAVTGRSSVLTTR